MEQKSQSIKINVQNKKLLYFDSFCKLCNKSTPEEMQIEASLKMIFDYALRNPEILAGIKTPEDA